MIHTANDLTAKHSRFLLSPVSIGLHALPPVAIRDAHADAMSAHNASSNGTMMANTHFSSSQLYSRGYAYLCCVVVDWICAVDRLVTHCKFLFS
jgi:hypothetical protein